MRSFTLGRKLGNKHMPQRKTAYVLAGLFLVAILEALAKEGYSQPSASRAGWAASPPALDRGSGAAETGPLLWYPIAQIIGRPGEHTVKARETLLDIARQHDLGYNELEDLYSSFDPWSPPVGYTLVIPSQRIIPGVAGQGIVINIPEMRLYYFAMRGGQPRVLTFPIGIGDPSFPTPVGTFTLSSKEINPVWDIPPSLQEKHGTKVIREGPDNPLGSHWMRLSNTMYGIHGTNFPWSVGRLATHGCIRLYPEDIRRLFPVVAHGTLVRIIYQPVKLAIVNRRIFIEIHRDVYNVYGDLLSYCEKLLAAKNLGHLVDQDRVRHAAVAADGMPVEITRSTDRLFKLAPRAPTSKIRINPVSVSPVQPRD